MGAGFRLSAPGRRLGAEFGKFGLIGVVNYALDIAVFNFLLFTAFEHAPWVAKACSTTVAAASSYFMNRHWTWRHRERRGTARELPIFLLISAISLGVTELCLLISHAGLGLTTKLDDNISANIVGVGLAMIGRFWAFRTFVFVRPAAQVLAGASEPAASSTSADHKRGRAWRKVTAPAHE